MRIYRSKKDIQKLTIDNKPLIYKGQMFFVDSVVDLPHYDEKTVVEEFEELGLWNNYGTIVLTNKKQ